jgi:hypothetical protein
MFVGGMGGNAYANATLNIARGMRYKVTRRMESYIVTHSGVNPLNPHQRANTQDPEV